MIIVKWTMKLSSIWLDRSEMHIHEWLSKYNGVFRKDDNSEQWVIEFPTSEDALIFTLAYDIGSVE